MGPQSSEPDGGCSRSASPPNPSGPLTPSRERAVRGLLVADPTAQPAHSSSPPRPASSRTLPPARATSPTSLMSTCPPVSQMRREAMLATQVSWVTTNRVWPCSRQSSSSRPMNPSRVLSSGCRWARRRSHPWLAHQGPGDGPRCCSPPESLKGRARHARRARRRRGPPGRGGGAHPLDAPRHERRFDVLGGRERGDRVEPLEDEAERVLLGSIRPPSPSRPKSRPSKNTVPPLGRSMAPSICSSVVLPEPVDRTRRGTPSSILRYTGQGMNSLPPCRYRFLTSVSS